MGKKAELEYHETPSNLLKGTLYGIGGMLLGSLPWVVIPVIFNTVYPVFAIFPLAATQLAMNYAKTKRNFVSLLIASMLAMVGSILGTYLSLIAFWLRNHSWIFDLEQLRELTQRILEDSRIMNDAINFSWLILGLLFILATYYRHKELKRLFHPEIEVIPSFKLH